MHKPLEESLNSPEAKKQWCRYKTSLKKLIRSANSDDRQSLYVDIIDHASVAFAETSGSEIDRLNSVLAQIGSPETVAEAYWSATTPPATGAIQRILNYVLRFCATVMFSITIVAALVALIMGFANIVNPDVGVWVHKDMSWSLSFEEQVNSRQLLRDWFSIWAFSVCAILAGIGLFLYQRVGNRS